MKNKPAHRKVENDIMFIYVDLIPENNSEINMIHKCMYSNATIHEKESLTNYFLKTFNLESGWDFINWIPFQDSEFILRYKKI